jgi:two-component system response regulator VanR
VGPSRLLFDEAGCGIFLGDVVRDDEGFFEFRLLDLVAPVTEALGPFERYFQHVRAVDTLVGDGRVADHLPAFRRQFADTRQILGDSFARLRVLDVQTLVAEALRHFEVVCIARSADVGVAASRATRRIGTAAGRGRRPGAAGEGKQQERGGGEADGGAGGSGRCSHETVRSSRASRSRRHDNQQNNAAVAVPFAKSHMTAIWAPAYDGLMRVLIVEDEFYLAEAIRDGLRLEAIAADVVGDGDSALERLGVNDYDAVVLDRDIPGVHGDEVARHIVKEGLSTRILMLTASRLIDEKVRGFEIGADDYLTKPFEMRELVMRLRALRRRPAEGTPPVYQHGGLTLDAFRREVYRDGRYIALTRKQFSVLEVLMAARGGVVSAESLLERAWDENADPFTNAVRITISSLRKRLGDPWLIHTVAGVGYRVDADGDHPVERP